MKKSVFVCGDSSAYIGYTQGIQWGGYDVPCFEKDEALKITRFASKLEYDAVTDAFLYENGGDYEQWDGYNADDKRFYNIGAYCWTWKELGDDDKLALAQSIANISSQDESYEQLVSAIVAQCDDAEFLANAYNIMRGTLSDSKKLALIFTI